MIERLKKNEKFEYQKFTPEEMKAKGILGRLVGPCADFINPTRNGRKYNEKLWENVFANPIMQEKIKNGVCFGELGHPADRTETDMEKIAVCLREQPKKNSKGQLCAVFDILDTPNGRILKTLCDYGSTIGVSSRGTGDLITGEDGSEMVDPDTYECEAWDIVLVPAVETARLQYVTESLHSKTTLTEALINNIDSATEEEKEIMKETLDKLNISLTEDKEEVKDMYKDDSWTVRAIETFDDMKSVAGDTTRWCVAKDKKFFDQYTNNGWKFYKYDSKDYGSLLLAYKDDEHYEIRDIKNNVFNNISELPAIKEIKFKLTEDKEEEVEMEVIPEKDIEVEVAQEVEKEEMPIEEPEVDVVDVLKDNLDITVEDSVMAISKKGDEESDTLEIEVSEEEAKVIETELVNKECNSENCTDKDSEKEEDKVEDESEVVINDETSELVENLQSILVRNSDLEKRVKSLQEELAVRNTKVDKLKDSYSKEAVVLREKLADAKLLNENITQKISKLEEELQESNKELSEKDTQIKILSENLLKRRKQQFSMNEELSKKETLVESLNSKINSLTEEVTKLKKEISDSSSSITREKKLKESYVNLANKTMNHYIEHRATLLGVTANEIKNRLPESYNIEDVDTICEELQGFALSVKRLPFDINARKTTNKKMKVNVVESRSSNINSELDGDTIDDSLINLAKLNK